MTGSVAWMLVQDPENTIIGGEAPMEGLRDLSPLPDGTIAIDSTIP